VKPRIFGAVHGFNDRTQIRGSGTQSDNNLVPDDRNVAAQGLAEKISHHLGYHEHQNARESGGDSQFY
jgi:hypothetical protein